jgi:hypothetical protein
MGELPFPKSLPEFQKLFPDDAHCAAYMERVRWPDGFVCPSCDVKSEPGRIATRPHVLRCKACKKEARLTAGTVMQDSHTPLLTWFWGAYLVASLTPGMSAVQFQRQLGLNRYETAFQILHKLRAGMVRRDVDMIGGVHTVELDETWVGGRTRLTPATSSSGPAARPRRSRGRSGKESRKFLLTKLSKLSKVIRGGPVCAISSLAFR